MLLALLSDTHDNAASMVAALSVLAVRKPEAYLHAGDLVSPEMLGHFEGLPLHFVFGNNEYDLATLRSRAKVLGLQCHQMFGDLMFGGKRVALLHGHDHALLQRVSTSGEYDYVVHGHTHVRRDERVGKTRILNPGALQRARVKTVAVLDTERDGVEFLTVLPGG